MREETRGSFAESRPILHAQPRLHRVRYVKKEGEREVAALALKAFFWSQSPIAGLALAQPPPDTKKDRARNPALCL